MPALAAVGRQAIRPASAWLGLAALGWLAVSPTAGQEGEEMRAPRHRVDLRAARLAVEAGASPMVRAAVDALQRKVTGIRDRPLPVAAGSEAVTGMLVLVGTVSPTSRTARVLKAWGLAPPAGPGAADPDDQRYLLAHGDWQGRATLLAAGASPTGTAYAVAELAGCLVSDGQGLAALLAGAMVEGRLVRRQAPAVAERGVYLNIPSPLPPLTVHEWDETRWSDYLDALLLARINRLYFYLWQDLLSDYAPAPDRREANRRLHRRLRWMIPEAQRRGIKVIFLFCPTFMPRQVWQRHPELHADIEYVEHGFPCLCPSRPGSWPLMLSVYRHELEWFRAADGFQIWFYDPGGCLCDACSADLAAPLLRQVEAFSDLIREKHPRAEIQVSLWPIWHWEARLGRRYGGDLLERLRAAWGPGLTIVDNAEIDASFLRPARELGFRTQGFLFSTNVETPFVFLQPQLAYLADMARRVVEGRFEGAFCHRLQPGSKFTNTLLAATSLWEASLAGEQLAYPAALALTSHPGAADRLARALARWDRALMEGVTGGVAVDVHQEVQRALALLPRARRERLEPLATSAHALAILGQAADLPEEAPARAALAARLREMLAASPAFHLCAAQAEAEFGRLVRWVGQGWARERF